MWGHGWPTSLMDRVDRYMARDRWQDPRAYHRLRDIDRAGLMWEWLRRDHDYVEWYTRASAATRATGEPVRWGLHFR
ncbi:MULTISPECIES: transcriptional regulator domain-containing protein [unclassified Novosphingobium]